MRTGLTKQEKTTDIWFDEKEPLIYIRTHNTDLKNRLTAYAAAHPGECRQTDADPDTGCMEFEIRKGRLSFRLTAPYREERRRAASEAAKNEKKGFRASLIVALATPPRWSCPCPSFSPPKRSRRGGRRSPIPVRVPVLRHRIPGCETCPPGRKAGRYCADTPPECRSRCRKRE